MTWLPQMTSSLTSGRPSSSLSHGRMVKSFVELKLISWVGNAQHSKLSVAIYVWGATLSIPGTLVHTGKDRAIEEERRSPSRQDDRIHIGCVFSRDNQHIRSQTVHARLRAVLCPSDQEIGGEEAAGNDRKSEDRDDVPEGPSLHSFEDELTEAKAGQVSSPSFPKHVCRTCHYNPSQYDQGRLSRQYAVVRGIRADADQRCWDQ